MEKMELLKLDLQHVWHPCSQMKDYEQFKPIIVHEATGAYIELMSGQKIIDAISSWWCKSLGHGHPRLKEALYKQVEKFEHVILANTTNETIVLLSKKLSSFIPLLNKVFYAGDGSCAIEIAMKMSLHARKILGHSEKTRFIALKNGYHGETLGALSVSDVGLYREPYEKILFKPHFIIDIPYVLSTSDELWKDCSLLWPKIELALEKYAKDTTALIVEPIIQGAGGMKIYSQDFLKRLGQWAKMHDIHLIADEIMTGIARTGKMFACEHAGITPDFLCLSKGLTSGWLPFSAVITHEEIYQLFYDDYKTGKAFLHSHTYSGNALAASIALETLNIIEEEKLCERANYLGEIMFKNMHEAAKVTGALTNVRSIGAIVAADLIPITPNQRLGYEFYQEALKLGALIRPLNNTIYWLPPINIDLDIVENLKNITIDSIKTIYCKS